MAEAKVLLEFEACGNPHRIIQPPGEKPALEWRFSERRDIWHTDESPEREMPLAVYREMAARLSQAERERDDEERACLEVMAERDRAVEAADALAYASGEVGEHSNMNCPWENGLECIAELHEKVKQAERELTEARGQWIACAERLPEEPGLYLVGGANNRVDTCEWLGSGKHWETIGLVWQFKITHWQSIAPVPAPPVAATQEESR